MVARSPSLSRSLADALKTAQTQPADAATIALARRYAALVEDAEATAAALDTMEPEDEGQAEQIRRLRARVDAATVASDLGPKLLAALTALGMTPAARSTAAKGGTPDAGNPAGDALDALRARRRARAN